MKTVRDRMRRAGAAMLGRRSAIRISSRQRDLLRRIQSLARFRTVIDVGAHHGEFALASAACLHGVSIHCFDPLPECQQHLRQLSQANPSIKAHAFAIGESDGRITINVNEFIPSSSILPMLDRHRKLWPKTANVSSMEVEIRRLDSFDALFEKAALLKIDVQGYEMSVLKGAECVLKKVAVLQIEINFEPLYEGQPTFLEVMNFLDQRGFQFREFSEERRLGADKNLIYADAIFTAKTGLESGKV